MASGSPALLCFTHLYLPPAAKGRADAVLCSRMCLGEPRAPGTPWTPPFLGAGQQENTESEGITGNTSPCFFLLGSLQQGTSVSPPWSSGDRGWEVSTAPKAPGLLLVPKQGVEGGGQGGQEDTQPVSKPGSSPDFARARRGSQRDGILTRTRLCRRKWKEKWARESQVTSPSG